MENISLYNGRGSYISVNCLPVITSPGNITCAKTLTKLARIMAALNLGEEAQNKNNNKRGKGQI